jgi:lipopolysaccharide export system permease protein
MGLSILFRYVFREVAAACLFCFGVFLLAGLIAGFLPLLQKGMEAGMELTLILFQVLINALPSTLVTVLPLSMTIGILLGLGRMSADNEVAAVKAAGISVLRLLPPVLLLGFIGFLVSLFCTLVLIPRGISEGRKLMHDALTTRADAGIEQRTFFDALKGLILYVENIDHSTRIITNIFLRESSKPDEVKTIIARKGKVEPDPEGKALILHLREGTIISEDKNGDSTGALAFESQIFRYPVRDVDPEMASRSLEEMSVTEIWGRIRDAAKEEARSTDATREFYWRVRNLGRILISQRFAYPLACLALALIAFPLGVINMGKSRLNNVAVGLVAIFLYYALSLATERAARSGLAPPEVAIPLTPLVFFAFGAYFVRCVQMERIPAAVVIVQAAIRMIRRERP